MDQRAKVDYGVDAPNVLRNFFLFGALCLAAAWLVPPVLHAGTVSFLPRPMLWGTGSLLLVEGLLFLFYVKVGKFRHRDAMLSMYAWRGGEDVLDVGCGRGLLLAGAARRLEARGGAGWCTGIDIWSVTDMAGNAETETRRNLELEGISGRCRLVSAAAQEMPFPDASFDLVVSNLCLHNIYDKALRRKAVEEIVRVLRPGGMAIVSDYKLTGEYAEGLRRAGWAVKRRWGNVLWTFPPLRIVVARKPA